MCRLFLGTIFLKRGYIISEPLSFQVFSEAFPSRGVPEAENALFDFVIVLLKK